MAYIQVQCQVDDMKHRQQLGLFVACIFTVMAYLFISYIAYMQRISDIDYKKWDF
jgi:hypothetical protein